MLISLNSCSDRKKKDKNYLLCCLAPNKKKLSCCNENIQYGCFKKLWCGIKRKLKFNGANNCPTYLTVCFTNSWNEFMYIERIKIPPAESCDVPIVYIKSWPYYIYMTMAKMLLLKVGVGILNFIKVLKEGQKWS